MTGSPEIWSPGQVPLDEVARQAAARQAAARQVPSKVQMPRTGSAFSRLPSEQVAEAQRAAAIQFGAGPMPEPTPLKRRLAVLGRQLGTVGMAVAAGSWVP